MSVFGSRLKSLRINSQLTLKEVAAWIDMSASSIRKYESGERTPTPDVIAILARKFGVSTDYLLLDNSPEEAPVLPMDIVRLALRDHPEVAEAISSADIKSGTINLNGEQIDINNIDLDYIKTSILSAIIMAKQKQESTIEVKIPLKNKGE